MNRRRAWVGLVVLWSIGCGRASESTVAATASPALPAPSATTTTTATRGPHLVMDHKQVEGRAYRSFGATGRRVALRLERPSRDEAGVLLAVAGTYTSPEDAVEGFVMLDGKVQQSAPMPWAGRVVIVDGRPRIERAASGASLPIADWTAARASVFQGHLLVHGRQPQPLKPSPARQRRALVALGDHVAVVESEDPIPLATFAADLVALGAVAALNLDMGGWSEGWARLSRGVTALGDNHRQTDRQSNWLVITL